MKKELERNKKNSNAMADSYTKNADLEIRPSWESNEDVKPKKSILK